jgi:hypothetical protein
VVALAVVAILACGSDVALGNPSDPIVTVTVYKPGGQLPPESITSGSLESRPQDCPPYGRTSMKLVGLQGPPDTDSLGPDTWSLATVLACLQPAVPVSDATGGVTVFQSSGEPESGEDSVLNTADLATHSDFQDPTDNPVVTDLGSSMKYDRPWRGGGDVNAPDQVTQSDPIQISVFEGQQIPVSITAPASVAAGSSASLTASANGTGLSFQWTLANGSTPSSTVPNPQVTFPDPGTYAVTVLVRDDSGDVGHAQKAIQVGPPSSATSTNSQTVTTGPNKSSGTTPGGTSGPKGGGKGSPTGKPTHQPSTKSQGSPSSNQHTHTTSTTQTSTTPSGGSGSGSGSGGGGSAGSGASGSGSSGSGSTGAGAPGAATTPSAKPPKPHTPKAPTHRRASPPAPGIPQLVAGQLISDVAAVPESASPLVHAVATQATPATAPALHPPARPSPWPIIGSALAVAALLGAGAWRELRAPGRRLPRWLRARPRLGAAA